MKFDTENDVKAEASAALGHLKADEALPELEHSANSMDPNVRESIALALGMASSGLPLPPSLLKLSRDKEASVRSWAALSLGLRKNAGEIELSRLFEMLNDDDHDVREEARQSIAILTSNDIGYVDKDWSPGE